MNKWVSPPKRIKTENETPDPPKDGFITNPPESFGFYLKQLGKKKPKRKNKVKWCLKPKYIKENIKQGEGTLPHTNT